MITTESANTNDCKQVCAKPSPNSRHIDDSPWQRGHVDAVIRQATVTLNAKSTQDDDSLMNNAPFLWTGSEDGDDYGDDNVDLSHDYDIIGNDCRRSTKVENVQVEYLVHDNENRENS